MPLFMLISMDDVALWSIRNFVKIRFFQDEKMRKFIFYTYEIIKY